MVSLRRRKLLRYYSGICSFPVELPSSTENGNVVENPTQNAESLSVDLMPKVYLSHKELINVSEVRIESSKASASTSSKEDSNHYFPGKQIKRRKRHRRKHQEDKEPCIMRGVYLKNMKWQAAIKVDKKQIHLGTVGSQEEAARLYDRAAYMCGREPNFVLSEEEKKELSRYKWEEFLAMTRNAITNKKHLKRLKKPEIQTHSSDGENERNMGASSMSDDEDVDTSVS